MTDSNLVEIAVVIDKSASMGGIWQEAVSSYNDFVEAQKHLPGRAKLSLVLFDTDYNLVHDGVDLREVPILSHKEHHASGMTAMNDAICRMIDTLGARLANTPESDRPANVIVVIITDGKENSSQEYNDAQVKQRVETQRNEFNWNFMFMSSDPTAMKQSQSMGIPISSSARLTKGATGYAGGMRGMSLAASDVRVGGGVKHSMQDYASQGTQLTMELEAAKKKREAAQQKQQ